MTIALLRSASLLRRAKADFHIVAGVSSAGKSTYICDVLRAAPSEVSFGIQIRDGQLPRRVVHYNLLLTLESGAPVPTSAEPAFRRMADSIPAADVTLVYCPDHELHRRMVLRDLVEPLLSPTTDAYPGADMRRRLDLIDQRALLADFARSARTMTRRLTLVSAEAGQFAPLPLSFIGL